MTSVREVLADGLGFAEGPRWRDGRLWFSDIEARVVLSLDPATGRLDEVATVAGRPSGLGWDPQGRMLVVSMDDRRILREGVAGSGALEVLADLSGLQPWACNDMVVDGVGRAYIGGFGFDLFGGAEPVPTGVALVHPDGSATGAAGDLLFPNGMVLVDDDRTLVVAESFAGRLTAYRVADDGSLSGRRLWADLPDGVVPDGICADEEGCIWTTSPATHEVLRVAEGGSVVERLDTGDRRAMACMLGGPSGRTLFLCSALHGHPRRDGADRTGRIEAVEVAVPRAGRP